VSLPLLWVVLLTWLVGCSPSQPLALKSTDITGAEFGRSFELTDHNGTVRRLSDFKGRVVVVFFGFTHCPDVCPTTLATMAKTLKDLGPQAAGDVQVLLITADPARDTPDVLKNYVTSFDPGFIGLTGDAAAIERTTREFKVVSMKTTPTAEGAYSVDHSTQSFVYDRQGRLRLFVPHSRIEEALGPDLRVLLAQR